MQLFIGPSQQANFCIRDKPGSYRMWWVWKSEVRRQREILQVPVMKTPVKVASRVGQRTLIVRCVIMITQPTSDRIMADDAYPRLHRRRYSWYSPQPGDGMPLARTHHTNNGSLYTSAIIKSPHLFLEQLIIHNIIRLFSELTNPLKLLFHWLRNYETPIKETN